MLPSGIWSKTGFFHPESPEETYTHYAEIGNSQVEMDQAVDLLRQAFDNPVIFADPRFNEFRKYIKSFYPVTRPDEDGFSSATWLEPAIPKFPLNNDELENNPGPVQEILGYELTMYDLMSFTHYLLTNTGVVGNNDPRLTWLEELRGDKEPYQF